METVIQITAEEIKSLTHVILTRYGIDFTCYEPKSLQRRVLRIMSLHDCPTVFELWNRVLRDPEFIRLFMNEISVGMTSMFRDPILWSHLAKRLPEEFSQRPSLNVWHAGCSTGEEVYTMGILLKEKNLLHITKTLATDINQDAIATARNGTYHKIRMLENEKNYTEFNPQGDFAKYYTTEGKHAMMSNGLIHHVNFNYHNLITDPIFGQFDLIFCRNVMIYFDNKAKLMLLEKFCQALKPGGYLVIGFYDTMVSLVDDKKLCLIDEEAKIFQKI